MPPPVFNLLASLPSARDAEVSQVLPTGRVRFERIVSLGQASPEGSWYDQEEAELVIVMSGRARLTIAGESRTAFWDLAIPCCCRPDAVTASPGPIPTILLFGWRCSLTRNLIPLPRSP